MNGVLTKETNGRFVTQRYEGACCGKTEAHQENVRVKTEAEMGVMHQ